MKIYHKPLINFNSLSTYDNLASLSTWLSTNGLEDAGITTYFVNS